MKLLHICAIGFTIKNLLLPQIDDFLKRGFSVEMVCSPGQEVDRLRQQGYVVHPVQIDRRIAPIANWKSILQLAALIRQEQYDLVHVHTPVASVLGRVAAKWAGTSRIVYTAHGFYFHDEMPANQYRFYHTVERAAAWLTDRILTQSREDWVTAQKTGLCPAEKVRYLGNGVDISRFQRSNLVLTQQQALQQSLNLPADASPMIGMTGRLTQEKGYLELIEALAIVRRQFPRVHLLVIGGQLSSERDAFQAQLSEQIQQRNLEDCVTFTGFRSDIPELLGLLDVFVLPSYREGLPRSILEAMAMALPVVTTDIRGCREAVVDGQTGSIVPPKDGEALAGALSNLLASVDLRTRWGQAGRQRVETEYDERLVFGRLADCYKELGLVPNTKR